MTDSGDDWNMRLRIRDLAGSSIWRHYEALRAHESALDFAAPTAAHATALHEARIDGKRLRYVLDFFEDVLGERASMVVDPLVALQDYLGALQDIEVATSYVAGLHVADEARPGLDAYRASRENERAALLAGLPQRWDKVMSGTYRRRLMELIVKL
jgi:CHAD domain-containing protein